MLRQRYSALTKKRQLYDADINYLEGERRFRRGLGSDVQKIIDQHALLLIKPEAIITGMMDKISAWLTKSHLICVYAKKVTLTPTTIRTMWFYQLNVATEARMSICDEIFRIQTALLIVVRRPHGSHQSSTSNWLSTKKGPAETRNRRTGELRHYIRAGRGLLNGVHTSDESADLIRELSILLEADDWACLLRVLRGDPSNSKHYDDLIRRQAIGKRRALDGITAYTELVTTLLASPAITVAKASSALEKLMALRKGDVSHWFELLSLLKQSGNDHRIWELIVLANDVLPMTEPGATPIIPPYRGVKLNTQFEHRHIAVDKTGCL